MFITTLVRYDLLNADKDFIETLLKIDGNENKGGP